MNYSSVIHIRGIFSRKNSTWFLVTLRLITQIIRIRVARPSVSLGVPPLSNFLRPSDADVGRVETIIPRIKIANRSAFHVWKFPDWDFSMRIHPVQTHNVQYYARVISWFSGVLINVTLVLMFRDVTVSST